MQHGGSGLISPIARPIVEDPDLAGHAEGLVGQTGAQVGQGDQQPVGEHQLISWPSAGLAPPVAAVPLAAPGLASRLPPRREFGDKLAKVSP
jgi:hypothetical protein